MSDSESQHEKQADDPIRLKPLVPRLKRATPVPSSPAHLCPRCDYDLTGLTSRRCPECGRGFTLIAARAHAFERSEAGRLRRREDRRQRSKPLLRAGLRRAGFYAVCALGIAAIIAGFLSPIIANKIAPPEERLLSMLYFHEDMKLVVRVLVLIIFLTPIDLIIAIIGARRGWGWAPILLTTGVFTLGAGLLIAMA